MDHSPAFLPRPATMALIGVLSAAACRSSVPPDPASRARTVRTAVVSDTAMSRPITGTGIVASRDELPLGFKLGGIVRRVLVDEGQPVRAGQLLAELDLSEIDAGVAKARSAMTKAERDVERIRRLYTDSVTTLVQFQDASTALDVARSDLDVAEFNQRYARIVSPAAGTILHRDVSPGELVAAGSPAFVLASEARGSVLRAGLADRDVVRLTVGDAATVRLDAYPDQAFKGVVREIAGTATPGTGTFAVEVSLPAGAGLATGLVGRVEIATRAAGSVTMVPVEAVVEADGDHGVVYVVDGARAARREVRIAYLDGARVGISGGLAGAGAVVTDGAAYLNDGDSVRVVP